MDLATIVGLVISAALLAIAVLLGGSPVMFIDPASIMIVVGGTIGATLVKAPLPVVLQTFKVAGKAFAFKAKPPQELIGRVTELSRKARKEGILALENVDCGYDFLNKAVQLCVDGLDAAEIRTILETEIRQTMQRHKRGQTVLEGMGQTAPAFGMIGTLIGLVQMLANMSDPSSIGPAMAVALLTTLYGALIANVICLPLADKLKIRSQEEALGMMICLEGVLGLSQGDNPGAIDLKLKSFLSPKLRVEEKAAA